MSSTNDKLTSDVQRLTDAVKANTKAVSELVAIDQTDAVLITDLKAQVATLQQAQPELDLTGLEQGITALENNNTAAQAVIVPPVPVV